MTKFAALMFWVVVGACCGVDVQEQQTVAVSRVGRQVTVPRGASEGSLVHALGEPCSAGTAVLLDRSVYEVISYGGQLLGPDSFWLESCGFTTTDSAGDSVGPCHVSFYFGHSNTWEFLTSTCPPLSY